MKTLLISLLVALPVFYFLSLESIVFGLLVGIVAYAIESTRKAPKERS